MSRTLTTEISEKLHKDIEDICEEEHIDKCVEVGRLLERAVREYKTEKILKKYGEGKISLGKAAEELGISIREVLVELKKRHVHFRYTEESLKEEFEAL